MIRVQDVAIDIVDSRYDACLLGQLPWLVRQIKTLKRIEPFLQGHLASIEIKHSCSYLVPGCRCHCRSAVLRAAKKL